METCATKRLGEIPRLGESKRQKRLKLILREDPTNDELERLNKFRPGGYFPVEIGLSLDDRYLVKHKLGHGGFGTVWLCLDRKHSDPFYVAVKICIAQPRLQRRSLIQSKLTLPKDSGINDRDGQSWQAFANIPRRRFVAESCNGKHECIVYPLLGPPIDMWHDLFEVNTDTIKKILHQTVIALARLHQAGICHAGTMINTFM